MSQLYDSQGQLTGDWNQTLNDSEMGEYAGLIGKYNSFDGLIKGFKNAEGLLGKKALTPDAAIVPNEGSSPEEVAAYRQAIGVPESATAYDLQPENLPEGMGWDEGLAGDWQNAFHEAGISQEQAAKLSQAYSDITNNQLTQANQTLQLQSEGEMEQQRAEMQKQWGDKYDTNLQNAVNMASTMGFDLENQHDMAAMRNPKVLNMILAKHDSLQEGNMPRGGQPNTGTESFRDQANALYGKYPNMMTAPHDVRAKYQELRKLSSMQPK